MSIRPVDINGMIQNTAEIGNLKHSDETKPLAQQQNIQVEMTRQMDERPTRVNNPDNADETNNQFEQKDASQQGSNSYEKRQGMKKKKEEAPKDRVIKKGSEHKFDISI